MSSIKVGIIDEDAVIRGGLEILFADDARFELMTSTSLSEYGTLPSCQVVIADPAPGANLYERRLLAVKDAAPDSRLIVYSIDDSEHLVATALRVKASAVLSKGRVSGADILEVSYLIARNDFLILCSAAKRLLDSRPAVFAGGSTADRPTLTIREAEILNLHAAGWTDTQIAEFLAISRSTVESHLTNAQERLQASSRSHAVALGILHGLLDPYTQN